MPDDLFLKHLPAEVEHIEAGADGDTAERRLRAKFTSFGSEFIDAYGDVINKKALDDYDGAEVAMVWSHDWTKMIGKGKIEVGKGYATWDGVFFDTDAGRDAYETVKAMGGLMQYSWGFRVKEARPIDQDGKPILNPSEYWWGPVEVMKAQPYEVSPVLVGANPGTGTLSIKADELTADADGNVALTAEQLGRIGARKLRTALLDMSGAEGGVDTVGEAGEGASVATPEDAPRLRASEEGDAALAAVSAYIARVQSLADERAAENRTFSPEHVDRLEGIKSAVEALLAGHRAKRGVPIGNRFRDFDLLRMKKPS